MDTSNLYHLDHVSVTHSKKFNTRADRYVVNVATMPDQVDIPTAMGLLRGIFESIMQNIMGHVDPLDFVRIVINSPSTLQTPISIPFMRRDNLSVDRLMDYVEKIIQSAFRWLLLGQFSITLYHVKMPQGGYRLPGRGKKGINGLHEYLKSKKSVVTIDNQYDKLCMARAIVISLVSVLYGRDHALYLRVKRSAKGKNKYQNRLSYQTRLALDLHNEAGVPVNRLANLDDAANFQQVLSKQNVQLNIFSLNHMNTFIYRGPEHEKKIYICLYKKHFCSLVSVAGFFQTAYWCEVCNKGYSNLKQHYCKDTCQNCLTRPPCQTTQSFDRICGKCNKSFQNEACYDKHIANNVCNQVKQCLTCHVYYKTYERKDKKAIHVCGSHYCKICHSHKPKNHKCYVKRLKLPCKSKKNSLEKEANEPCDLQVEEGDLQQLGFDVQKGDDALVPNEFAYAFYDLETSSVRSDDADALHIPILCVVQLCCNRCSHRSIEENCSKCGDRQVIFQGEGCLAKFCKWLFTPRFQGRTVFAHNGGAYDHIFCLKYMHDHLIYPQVICRGSKLIFMEVPEYKIKFLDSLNYMKSKLSKLPSMVNLPSHIESKGYFPYRALKREYYGYCGPKLASEFYIPGSMTPDERTDFFKWYNRLPVDYVFNFKEELLSYCITDVTILRLACLKFKNLMIHNAGLDPFYKSPTISGYSHRVYRSKFMPENTIGVIPANNYVQQMTTSFKAIAYLEFESQRLGHIPIRHAGTAAGEMTLLGIKVDGYIQCPEIVYMFSGCFFHGCRMCYPGNMDHPFHKGQKMAEVYECYQRRLVPLKAKYHVKEIWEHEYDEKLKCDSVFSNFVANLDLERHKFIIPRQALLGGRCEVYRLYHNCDSKHSRPSEIHYRDVISLYPRVLRDCKMPKGHPTLYHITTDTIGDISQYFGLVRIKILPPTSLFIPMIPHKTKGGKLVFSLCRTCADNVQTDICQHSDEERAIIGTYTTEEIKASLKYDYKVITIYHVWHYKESSQYNPEKNTHGVFSEFVNTFHKMKVASSGFPSDVKSDLQKRAYVKSIEAKDKIKLSVSEITDSPGVRNISKLLLNSSWGRQAYNECNSRVMYFTQPHEFYEMLRSPRFELDDLQVVNDDMIRVTVTPDENFVVPTGQGSIIYSIFTTSYGRMFIGEKLQLVNHNSLYVDTDGVLYIKRPLSPEIPLGISLGAFKNELKDKSDNIIIFAGAGLKSYGFKTRKGMVECKLKGISLDYDACKQINLESMVKMVTQNRDVKIVVTYPNKIKRPRHNVTAIQTVAENKTFQFVFDKRVIRGSDYLTFPFGYRGPTEFTD